MTTELVSANHAAAIATTLAARANRGARGFGSGVYPITPQTECIEYLCNQKIEKGHVVRAESEHSAMAICIGFSLAGSRSFTASSSNGLAYMTENVFAAAFYRLPIVMMAVNRTLGPPWNIWADHGDTLALRDAGWLQFYCEDNQEVADSILAAFRIAEDRRVLLPVLVCQDAFILSHTMMMTDFPSQEQVDRFLPHLDLPQRLLPTGGRTIGGIAFPHETELNRIHHQRAMEQVPEVYREVQASFQECFGRPLADPAVPYLLEDAEVVLVSMGTMASTARAAVDAARAKGIRAGSLRLRMFRPLPEEELRHHLGGKARIAVCDRDLCPGLGGIVWGEIRGALPPGSLVQNYIVGVGGGDVRPESLLGVIEDIRKRETPSAPVFVEVG